MSTDILAEKTSPEEKRFLNDSAVKALGIADLIARFEPPNADNPVINEPFPRQSDVRQSDFVKSVQAQGLTEEAGKALYELSGGASSDPVTGFQDSADRMPTLARAIEQARQPGADPSFTIDVSILNLGGLNAKFGHTGADEVVAKFAEIVSKAMDKIGGVVSKFREAGTELRFIIVGKDVRQSHIEAALMAAQAEALKYVLGRGEGIEDMKHPKHEGDLSQKGTGITYDIDPIKPAHNADDVQAEVRPSKAPEGKNFKPAAQVRRDEFVKKAVEQYHLKPEAAVQLYEKSGAAKIDALTGFDSPADRIATLKSSMEYIQKSKANGFYVEIDVRNLAGLTKAVGRGKADAVFATLASLAEQAVTALDADVSRFRHGGDEISFIVIGGNGVTEGAIDAALTGAQAKIAAYVKSEKLDQIEHPKHPNDDGKRGTGIVFGISAISGTDPEQFGEVLSAADVKVEAKKK